ncbi:MAG TPA: TIGR02679 family protein [bacterium]|nr:TIGR02679 family protein [bacterium]
MDKLKTYLTQPGLRRLWPKVKIKYQSLNRIGGKIKLRRLTVKERDAIGGLLAISLLTADECTVELAALDRALQRSRFKVNLVEVLEYLYGPQLQTKKEQTEVAARRWSELFTALEQTPMRPQTKRWLQTLKHKDGPGYRTFFALYQQDRSEAGRALRTVAQALDHLPCWQRQRTRLPVFSAWLSGDPHRLDSNTAWGRLFFQGLLFALGIENEVVTAEQQREVLAKAGLMSDDISSTVIVAGLCPSPSDPRAPIFTASNNTCSPLVLPLRFFRRPTAWEAMPAVYVLENPSVFSTILDLNASCPPPLVCTSGQPSVAALKLVDEITAAGSTVYYSGDFDPEGLQMGIRFHQRYGAAFRPWFFDRESYDGTAAGTRLTADQRQALSALIIPWDKTLAAHIRDRGLVVYQESLLGPMVRDLSH